jgi:TPR repeat protein
MNLNCVQHAGILSSNLYSDPVEDEMNIKPKDRHKKSKKLERLILFDEAENYFKGRLQGLLKRSDAQDTVAHAKLSRCCVRSSYLSEGFAWLKRLSSAGYTEAQFYLGNAYRDDEQYDRAYTQYSLAAKRLHPGAEYHTALAKENGVGTKKDFRGALELFKKSATNGYVPAMYKLGMCFTVCIHLVSLINLERRSVVQTKTPRSN